MAKGGAPWRDSVKPGQETRFSAVPPRWQDFGALSDTVASWPCEPVVVGAGGVRLGGNCFHSSSAAAGDILGRLAAAVLDHGVLSVTSSVTLNKPFHPSEPQCPCQKSQISNWVTELRETPT